MLITFLSKEKKKKRYRNAGIMGVIVSLLSFVSALLFPGIEVPLLVGLVGAFPIVVYIFFGGKGSLSLTGFFAFVIGTRFLPEPYDFFGGIVALVIVIFMAFGHRRFVKRLLKKSDLEMTKSQKAEILDATQSDVVSHIVSRERMSSKAKELLNEKETIIKKDFIRVVSTTSKEKEYILKMKDHGLALYLLEPKNQKRTKELLMGLSEVVPTSNDLVLEKNIHKITLLPAKHFAKAVLHLVIETGEEERVYRVEGHYSACQIEEFITRTGNIKVDNQVSEEQGLAIKRDNIDGSNVISLIQGTPEEIAKLRKRRDLCRLINMLSVITILLFWLGVPSRTAHVLMAVWPIVVTLFYVIYQSSVSIDGEEGRPIIGVSYLFNPFISVAIISLSLEPFLRVVGWSSVLGFPQVLWSGLMATALFIFCTLRFIKECRRRWDVMMGMIIIGILFGIQMALVVFRLMLF